MKSLFGHNYEHRSQPLASRKVYLQRVYRNIGLAVLIMFICLLIGVLGYRYTAPMSWIDALHNASMILSGMGPVAEIQTVGGKIFSSAYALFSGVAFITNIGILLTPVVHRFFHKLHVEEEK
jgi:hypothetical protein